MASPLSPAQDAVLNSVSPQTKRKYDDYDMMAFPSGPNSSAVNTPEQSKMFLKVKDSNASDQENETPTKNRHSRVMSGNELSPLRIVESQRTSIDSVASLSSGMAARSPRKMSPEKRFPVKISVSKEAMASAPAPAPAPAPVRASTPPRAATHERTASVENAVVETEGLQRAIAIFEDEQSMLDDEADDSLATIAAADPSVGDETAAPDESMISTFSSFSAVPNLTMFAKLGQTPSKMTGLGDVTPRTRRDRSPVKSSRHTDEPAINTNMLIDFTEGMRNPQRSPGKRGNMSPPPRLSSGSSVVHTPSRQYSNLGNLIDFDIPPMPTPRSVPTITPRELESLKSNFLSEISSLKASLSGKEAEVHSLKSAVGDAEKRVGQSLEKLREERTSKEQLAVEKEGWENRGREMENMLRKFKEEILINQTEREDLERQLEESEKRREAAEMMHQEAETKLAGLRGGKEPSPEKLKSPTPNSNREVEIAVERVARELHALYKSKHETKVAALKKSYENRWEKKVRILEAQIEQLSRDNEHLRNGPDPDATMAQFNEAEAEERKAQAVRDSAAIKELDANVLRLEAVVSSVQRDNEELRKMLQQERVEKGELVQLAEELMGMQQQGLTAGTPAPRRQQQASSPQAQYQPQVQPQQQPDRAEMAARTPRAPTATRGSGLRAPGASGLRPPASSKSSAGGLPRPGVKPGGIMGSIEKMGNYRGRAE
ncbi:hypothetical protein PT974_11199 [Cladobotryum mycophilum]|uniref:Kinetoplast-associated protein KAP n=1 Tax=Cladobotryum mycophilum TaxID=491253 RepID=A0ABR0S5X1_9HYPO